MSVDVNNSARHLPTGNGFRNLGYVFLALGLLALLLPSVATIVIEQLIAVILVIWGLSGLMFAFSFRAFSEWRLVAAGFAAMLGVGLWFIVVPGVGASVMTALLIVAFLVEGLLSILLGLRMSGQLPNWLWVVASGGCAFVLGLILLFQWPMVATWVIGFLVGLNFLSTGLTLVLIARALRTTR